MFFASAFSFSLIGSLLVAVSIVSTQRIHGKLSMDSHPGVQKLHRIPTPRIGGIALLVGALVGGLNLPAKAQYLWWLICASCLPAYIFGLVEDLTKRVGVRARLECPH